MMKLYRHPLSGNAHRAELFLSLLKLDYQLVDVDLLTGEQKNPEFIAKNPFGRVPVLEDDSITISESNAILVYLAKRYGDSSWLPNDSVNAAEVERWLAITAHDISEGPAAARLVTVFNSPNYDLESCQKRAQNLFEIINQHLSNHHYLIGDQITIADIAAYAYIAHAPEGGVSLDGYSAITDWLARVEALNGFVPMQKTEVSQAA